MDPTNDLMLAPNEADPQQLLQDLLAISNAPAASRTGATASTFPSHHTPMPPPIAMPAPMPSAMPTGADPSTGGGTDWRAILRLIAPAVGSLVASGGHQAPAFWSGYQGRLAEMDQQRRQQQQQAENKRKAAAEFILNGETDLEKYDDPALLAQHVQALDDAGARAGFTKPGEIKAKGYRVPESKLAEKSLKELTDLVDGAIKAGYDPDQLTEAGAVLTRKDGSTVPFETAYELTHRPPMTAQGKPIAKPPKPAKDTAGTEKERAAQLLDDISAAQLAGDTAKVKQLQAKYANLVKVTTDLGAAGRSPVDPDVADMNKTLKQLAIDSARTRANGGAPADGGLDPDGIEFAATQYRVTGAMPSLGVGNSKAKNAIINAAAKQAKELGQSPANAVQKQAAYKGDAAALKKMQTMSAAAESFETKALAQADIVEQLSQKVDRTQWPIINQAIVSGKTELLGDKDAQLLANAITTFSAEYSKILEGSTGSAAGSSDAARRAADRLISAKLNKGTLSATLELMKREMSLTLQGYGATIQHITTRMGGAPTAAPASTTTTPTTPGAPIKVGGFTVVVK
jgi:hypothetical protein